MRQREGGNKLRKSDVGQNSEIDRFGAFDF